MNEKEIRNQWKKELDELDNHYDMSAIGRAMWGIFLPNAPEHQPTLGDLVTYKEYKSRHAEICKRYALILGDDVSSLI